MLSLLTSLAEKWGRNTTAVYNMVQSNQAFSANEAVAIHVADGTANSLSDALNQLGLSGNPQVTLSEDLYEQIISALSNATLDGILFLVGVIAIVLDIYHPTIMLTILGIIAIVAGLVGAEIIGASLLGIVILVMAAALIVAELKLGHGFALMAGVVLGAFGIYYLSLGLQYSPSPITSLAEIELGLLVVFGVIIGLYIRWMIGPIRRRSKLTGSEAMIGKTGIAITDLKPKGEARVAGEIWRAESLSGDIAKGEAVSVKALNGLVVMVEKVQEQKVQATRSAVGEAVIPYPVNQKRGVKDLLRVDKKFRSYGPEDQKIEYHMRPHIEAVNSFLKTQYNMASNKVRGLGNVACNALYSVFYLVLNREAAQNIDREDKAVSPTYFNT